MSNQTDPSEFWRAQARRYDRAVEILNPHVDEMACRVATVVEGSTALLEIAAGTGLVTQRLAPVVEKIVATDRSPEMLEILEGRLAEARLANVSIRVADALELPFADASFDAVVMANLLHLLPKPSGALQEARRVLRPGGLVCAPTFCHGDTMVAHLVSRVLGLARFPVVTRFSGDELVATLEESGLAVVERTKFRGLLPLWLVVARRA